MAQKEKIIKILKTELQAGNIEMIHINIEQFADKLALPLDVPSDKELVTEVVVRFMTRNPHPKSRIYLEYEKKAFINGAKLMQDEIIRRNK